jgi:hypothetical protein
MEQILRSLKSRRLASAFCLLLAALCLLPSALRAAEPSASPKLTEGVRLAFRRGHLVLLRANPEPVNSIPTSELGIYSSIYDSVHGALRINATLGRNPSISPTPSTVFGFLRGTYDATNGALFVNCVAGCSGGGGGSGAPYNNGVMTLASGGSIVFSDSASTTLSDLNPGLAVSGAGLSSPSYALTGAGGMVYEPTTFTIAGGLPASPSAGWSVWVTDGNGAADCTAGGGSNVHECFYDGSAWVSNQAATSAGGSVSDFVGYCTGTVYTSSTLSVLSPAGGSAACNSSNTAVAEVPLSHAGTFKNLYCNAAVAGNGTGGVVTLYINGSAQSASAPCSFGSTSTCNDTTDTYAATAGQTFSIRVSGGTGATLAGVRCTIDYQ